jgi:hypothetical protein
VLDDLVVANKMQFGKQLCALDGDCMRSRLFPGPELVLMACLSVLPATVMCAEVTIPANTRSVNSTSQIVEVPPYVDSKVGEIRVVRATDGTLSIVSSDYQPDHEKWPGRINCWPLLALEYRRARSDL